MRTTTSILTLLCLAAARLAAQAPDDNRPDKVRPVPPPGVEIPAAERAELEAGVTALSKEIESLRGSLKNQPAHLTLLPDVIIFDNAVRYALAYNEFHHVRETAAAKSLLAHGLERAKALREGKSPWTTAAGLVVRGYQSKIDGSVQPYGLVVPPEYDATGLTRHRLDLWLHGRGETLSEVNFITGRMKVPGELTPAGAFVLHPYGRYCNASKFAGEIDVLEAMEHVKRNYRIDDNRVAVRGFSMGGASTWHLAVHYPSLWAAANPGAGFAETGVYLNVVKNETVQPTWYHKKLWHLYDATDYAVNLFNCPTVAYSGAIDTQKQAADIMASAMAAEGLTLAHVIGPNTGHKYEAGAKVEVARRLDSIMTRGRETSPRHVRFTTFTLRYNQAHWVTIDRLDQHWERARVEAEVVSPTEVKVTTQNVTGLSLVMPAGSDLLDAASKPTVKLDGQTLQTPPPDTSRAWQVHFRKSAGKWSVVDSPDEEGLHKRHLLQGPIDDAFMDSFLMVRPTGKPASEKVANWAAKELSHSLDHWRKQFRGDARVKDDTAVSDEDIANSNLVLWGDPSSNQVLAKIVERLPIRWTAESIQVAAQTFPADTHVPVLVYPNPLNPNRYVVLNSGFTFREYDYLTNARQTPKLPDYAVIDVRVPPSTRFPGEVVAADFFDERWQVKVTLEEKGNTNRR